MYLLNSFVNYFSMKKSFCWSFLRLIYQRSWSKSSQGLISCLSVYSILHDVFLFKDSLLIIYTILIYYLISDIIFVRGEKHERFRSVSGKRLKSIFRISITMLLNASCRFNIHNIIRIIRDVKIILGHEISKLDSIFSR